jgi:hypothetical protein
MTENEHTETGSDDRDPVAPVVASSVREIVAAAERSAARVREEVEGAATRRASQLEGEARRHADDVIAAAEAESQRRIAAAEVRASQYLAECRRLIDQFAEERTRRIGAVSDSLISFAEDIEGRFRAAEEVRGQAEALIVKLGAAAEELARESADARSAEPPLPPAPSEPDSTPAKEAEL